MAIEPCATTAPIRGAVVFVPADFKAAFPAFATVADPSLANAFTFATLQFENGCGSRVKDAVRREQLLNLLTAHIAQLLYGVNGQAPSGLVGRVERAQEGSVSVEASMGNVTNPQAYYMQTQWGAMFWQSTAQYRTMLYVPPPAACPYPAPGAGFGPVGTGWPGFNGGTS